MASSSLPYSERNEFAKVLLSKFYPRVYAINFNYTVYEKHVHLIFLVSDPALGLVLATGAGALGVRLGGVGAVARRPGAAATGAGARTETRAPVGGPGGNPSLRGRPRQPPGPRGNSRSSRPQQSESVNILPY